MNVDCLALHHKDFLSETERGQNPGLWLPGTALSL